MFYALHGILVLTCGLESERVSTLTDHKISRDAHPAVFGAFAETRGSACSFYLSAGIAKEDKVLEVKLPSCG